MVRDAILSKIKYFLSTNSTLDQESQVAYIMVELRKILEHDRPLKKYPILKFYCDWTLHIKINDSKPIQETMQAIEQSIIKGQIFTGDQFLPDGATALDFISLTELQKEMMDMFKENNLPETIFLNNNWENFRHQLLRILANQPITNPTENINKVYFLTANKGAAFLQVELNSGRKYGFANVF